MRRLSFKDAELVAILVLGRKSGGSEVQRHPQVYAELEASLGYLRPCLEFSPQNRPHTSYYVIFIALDNLKFCDKARLLLTEFCLFFPFSFNWSDPCLLFFFFPAEKGKPEAFPHPFSARPQPPKQHEGGN